MIECFQINVNTASLELLQSVEILEEFSERIIEGRPFAIWDDFFEFVTPHLKSFRKLHALKKDDRIVLSDETGNIFED